MAFWLFFGGFLAVVLVVVILVLVIRREYQKLKSSSPALRIVSEFVKGLHSGELDFEVPEEPKSLNRCDSLLIPQILKDFPDFDVDQARSLFKDFIRQRYSGKQAFTIHAIGISRYLRTGIQKTIVMQASVSYTEAGKRRHVRAEADYMYAVDTRDETIAANCPNCGGAIGYGVVVCPYCDSRVANVMGNTWTFKNLTES
jgi:hypothetical protein